MFKLSLVSLGVNIKQEISKMEPSLQALGRVSVAGGWIVDKFSLYINVTRILVQSKQGVLISTDICLCFFMQNVKLQVQKNMQDSALYWCM